MNTSFTSSQLNNASNDAYMRNQTSNILSERSENRSIVENKTKPEAQKVNEAKKQPQAEGIKFEISEAGRSAIESKKTLVDSNDGRVAKKDANPKAETKLEDIGSVSVKTNLLPKNEVKDNKPTTREKVLEDIKLEATEAEAGKATEEEKSVAKEILETNREDDARVKEAKAQADEAAEEKKLNTKEAIEQQNADKEEIKKNTEAVNQQKNSEDKTEEKKPAEELKKNISSMNAQSDARKENAKSIQSADKAASKAREEQRKAMMEKNEKISKIIIGLQMIDNGFNGTKASDLVAS